jgi:hypothetical protein
MRLVWTWLTGVGGGDIVRRAAAAAADERFALDERLARKACAAADCAGPEAAGCCP